MKKMNWSVVQTACFVGFFVILNLSLRSGKPVDPSRQLVVWMFRAIAGGVCLLGVIVAALMQRRQKAEETPIDSSVPSLPPETRAISVTYENTLEAARRCELFTLLNRNFHLVFFTLIAMSGAWLAAARVARFSVPAALLAFPILQVIVFGVFLGYIAVISLAVLRTRFPHAGSVRVCTTSLTADGFQDVTPDKIIPYSWDQIRQIREVGGDVYIWRATSGCYIPRGAFEDLDAARRYHRAAVILWQSRGRVWPNDVPSVIDRTRSRPEAPAASPTADDNPYSAPRAPLRDDLDPNAPSPYSKVIKWTVGMMALEYLVIVPFLLVRS